MSWKKQEDGTWRHAPWFKVMINTMLRFFQTRRRPARLYVLATRATDGEPPTALGYVFCRVLHLSDAHTGYFSSMSR